MVRTFIAFNFSEREEVIALSISLAHFTGVKLIDGSQILATTFSKDSIPYEKESLEWMQHLLSLARRELSYDAAQHLAPGAIRPIGEGTQHVLINPDEVVDPS